MKQVHYAIIGSGVAGLSVAYFLAKKGARHVLLLEQERHLGLHSSGQNAGMIRQVVPNLVVGRLARKGARFLRNLPPRWKTSFQPCGSFLLVKGKEKETLHRLALSAKKAGLSLKWFSVKKTIQKIPILAGADFETALFCPTDGVIDIHALLQGYLKEGKREGAEIWMGAKVKAIRPDGKAGFQVETLRGKVKADILINAAGAWAGPVANMAGAQKIPFRSFRRHLLLSKPLRTVDPKWPFVWDMTHAVYFRPDGKRLLLSPCDQDLFSPRRCPTNHTRAWKRLRERLVYFPNLPKLSIQRSWGGLRTFSPDDCFCIGWDRKRKNFFWVAGLDGHGMTTGSAVGDFASSLLLGRKVDPYLIRSFTPRRFQ